MNKNANFHSKSLISVCSCTQTVSNTQTTKTLRCCILHTAIHCITLHCIILYYIALPQITLHRDVMYCM